MKLKGSLDAGSVAHFLYGALSVPLGLAVPATLILLTYQLIDYHAGEGAGETCLDIVEFAAGLLFAGLLVLFAPFI